MNINEFKSFIDLSVKNGTVSESERDDIFYDCAIAQLENSDLNKLFEKIVSEIKSRG